MMARGWVWVGRFGRGGPVWSWWEWSEWECPGWMDDATLSSVARSVAAVESRGSDSLTPTEKNTAANTTTLRPATRLTAHPELREDRMRATSRRCVVLVRYK
eukprot:m.301119 g.301119  ORF g.301119 m.301119 type:complete len:102 (-) comp27266_c0_seq1:5-310(-)